MGGLFGRSRSSSRQESGFQTLPAWAQNAYQGLITNAQQYALNPELFRPADFNEIQLGALGQMQAPTSAQQYQQRISPYTNAFLEQVIGGVESDLNRNLSGQLSEIGSRASATGGFGGTRQALLESEAFRNTQDRIGNISGQLRAQDFYNAGNMFRGDIDRQLAAGGQIYGLSEGQRQAPLAGLSYLASILSGAGPQLESQTSFSNERGAGALASPQGIGGAIAAIGQLFSDSRLKENIRKVSEYKGVPLYSYNYVWGPKKYIGVMAQDIIFDHPKCVGKYGGYYVVDYNKLLGELNG